MAKIMMTGERKQIQVPVILPTVGTSGSIPLTVPFKAEYFAVLNSSGATINMARGRLSQLPADSITISPNIYISLSIEETQEMTLFWNGGVNSSNNQLLVIFSNEEIPVLGGSMVTGGVASNVSVSNTPNVILSASAATIGAVGINAGGNNIGRVNVDVLPSIPAGGNSIGTVGLNAGTNVIGHVNVDSLPSIPTGGNTIGNVGINAGSNNIGNVGLNAGSNTIGAVNVNGGAQALTTGIVSTSQASITTTAAALTLPANITQLVLKNMDASATIYIGASGVTTGNGFPIPAGGSMSFDLVKSGTAITMYAIGSAACSLAILGVA